jgi:uroporphyrinogen decarboxylase
MSPEFLRAKILTWHKRCAEVAHAKGKPYLLHSCGKLDEIMDDLISNVGIDAKHSFEDAILPVTEAKRLYGNKVALLGGIDMDFLCRSDESSIRERVRETLQVCTRGGGYCLGTGNTVANYVPLDNYLSMIDEGRRFSPGS